MVSTAQLIDIEKYAVVKVKDALDLLECPICCEERLFPPVYQCKNGHAICSTCKSSVGSSCPTCRSGLDAIRSLPFEKLFDVLRFTCKFYKFGCFESLPYNAKLQHEKTCLFRPLDCPYPLSGCEVTGDAAKIVSHMKSSHRCRVVDHPISYEFAYTKPLAQSAISFDVAICSHLGEHFCLCIKSTLEGGSASFFIFLMFVGESAQAEKFHYEVQVSKGVRERSHKGVPYSIRDGYAAAEALEDGLVINNKAAQLLSTDPSGNFKFAVTGKIWK